MTRRSRLMARLLRAGATDPWVLLVAALLGGGAWAVGLPAVIAAGIASGAIGAGAIAVALTNTEPLPVRQTDPTLAAGTEQGELVAALDGYVADLADLVARRGTGALPDEVRDAATQALVSARDSRTVALKVAVAVDGIEAALARSTKVNSRWSGSHASATIGQSLGRMRERRETLLERLTRTVTETAELYTKLLEVSSTVDTVHLSHGGANDVATIDASLESLRTAVSELEREGSADPLRGLDSH